MRGFGNVFVLVSLVVILFMLFAGYPMLSFFLKRKSQDLGTYGLGGSNGTGQVPVMASNMRLVDTDTPENAKKWTNLNGQPYHLVFSDEFNVEGRTFWPGDDPFWEAVDIWCVLSPRLAPLRVPFSLTRNITWPFLRDVRALGTVLQATTNGEQGVFRSLLQ